MTVQNKRSLLSIVSVIALVAMLLAQSLVFPVRTAHSAGTTDLYVGYPGKSNNYATIQEAVNKAGSIKPSGESERVTIHIAPGTYREQVVVQTPYVSFVNDEPSKEVLITWYYGIGYKYYSANERGWYDADAAKSKSAKNPANYRWGATVQLWSNAKYFKAENITFENSFNRYVTKEEIADGVEATGETLTVARTSNSDVQSKDYTERAAAFSDDAGYCEFLGCEFLSSQDTLYTGASPEYYRNCVIEGQTDYIFGDCSAVFDSCELRWKGYSSGSVGGYITAGRDDDNDDTGYLFNNCTITANSALTVKAGYLGRPWRETAKAMFINTTLAKADLIAPEGWTSMSGVLPENVAGFKEYGTKLADGTAVSLSSRKGHTVSATDAGNIKLQNYMKNWTPTYLNASSGSNTPSGGNSGTSSSGAIKVCGGWFEEAFAEWDSSAIGSNVKVSYSESGSNSYKSVDSQLIRGTRVDIPGLKGNTKYDIKIEGSAGSATCTVTTMKFDRSGYAHYNYTSGVGAYKDDGTLKSGAEIIYITDSNKDTVTYNGQTGLYNIFYRGKPKNVVFRFIGSVKVPSGTVANNGSNNDGSNMLYLQYAENVTIEGIGYDTDLVEWGFETKRSTSVEIRNLYLAKYPDDGISVSGGKDQLSEHIWIHNNSIMKGYNAYAGNGTVDDDKADGDGSTDVKYTHYVTISYNYYENCHKTSLVGGGAGQLQDWITYHHNWFNNTESRNPRAREAHIHTYNNYFVTNKQYAIGASYNSKIFSESNYFEKSNLPLDAENMGSDKYSGTIKSYNDKFDNCKMGSDLAYKIVTSRTEKAAINNLVSGGDPYDNFDLNMYSYTAQSPEQAKEECMNYSGKMQNKAYNAGTSSGGSQGGTGTDTETLTPSVFAEGSAYTIKNVNSGLYMEVKDNKAENGANVQQWGLNDGTAGNWNTWRLFSAGDGYYYIISGVGDTATYALDVTGKKSDNGTNIEIYQYKENADNQKFMLTKNSDGSYKIRTKVSGGKSAVEIADGSSEHGANVQEWEINGANCQDWILEPADSPMPEFDTDLVYTFTNANSGLVMEVKDGKIADGQNVQQWEENGADCQKWTLKKFSGGEYYYILSLQDSSYTLRCEGSENGSNISLAKYSTKDSNMLFRITKNPDGSYNISTRSSKDTKLVEVSSADKTAGANVAQWEYTGNACQKWNIKTSQKPAPTETTSTTKTTENTTTNTTAAKTTAGTDTPSATAQATTAPKTDTTTTPTTTTTVVTLPKLDGVLYGDANGDGNVTIADSVAILQFIANPDEYSLSDDSLIRADVCNGDGVNTEDALTIQLVDAGVYSVDILPIKR